MNKNEWINPALVNAFKAESTDAYRLCTSGTGWIERFANDVLISYQDDQTRQHLVNEIESHRDTLEFKISRIFGRLLPKQNQERAKPHLLSGEPETGFQTIATERKLKYSIDFGTGYSAGLFLDQRENRSFVQQLRRARLLNCFAYTCSFSVAAAAAGARTVNIDLSKKWLNRGKQNLELNGLNVADHRFIEDDVRPVLRRMTRRADKFDIIILDPPTFSHTAGGKAFHVQEDFAELIARSLEIANEQAWILLSTNCTSIDPKALKMTALTCLKDARLTGKFHQTPPPIDYPDGFGANTVWLSLD